MAKKKRRQRKYEFRPDPTGTKLLKKLHLTKYRRMLHTSGGTTFYRLIILPASPITSVTIDNAPTISH